MVGGRLEVQFRGNFFNTAGTNSVLSKPLRRAEVLYREVEVSEIIRVISNHANMV